MDADDLLTSGEIAELFDVGTAWVGELARRGRLPVARRTTAGRLYYRRDIEPLIEEREAARRAGKPRRGRPRKVDKLRAGLALSTQPQEQEVRSA